MDTEGCQWSKLPSRSDNILNPNLTNCILLCKIHLLDNGEIKISILSLIDARKYCPIPYARHQAEMDKSLGFNKGEGGNDKKLVHNFMGPNWSTRSKSLHVKNLKDKKSVDPLVLKIIFTYLNRVCVFLPGKDLRNDFLAAAT